MGYNHSLTARISFKAGITEEAALQAMQPLAVASGWSNDAILCNSLPGDDTIEIAVVDGFAVSIELFTCGQVPYTYTDVINQFAEGLANLAEADFIELRDHSTNDLSNAILEVWYGASTEIELARQQHAWRQAISLLRAGGVPEQGLRLVRDAMAASSQPAAPAAQGNTLSD